MTGMDKATICLWVFLFCYETVRGMQELFDGEHGEAIDHAMFAVLSLFVVILLVSYAAMNKVFSERIDLERRAAKEFMPSDGKAKYEKFLEGVDAR